MSEYIKRGSLFVLEPSRAEPDGCGTGHGDSYSTCETCGRLYCFRCKRPGHAGSLHLDLSAQCGECRRLT